MAAAALVVVGVVLVILGIFAGGMSYPIIGLGVVCLIAAGILRVLMSRRT